jgi:hypothetical protein
MKSDSSALLSDFPRQILEASFASIVSGDFIELPMPFYMVYLQRQIE